jgi:hypothetical protein
VKLLAWFIVKGSDYVVYSKQKKRQTAIEHKKMKMKGSQKGIQGRVKMKQREVRGTTLYCSTGDATKVKKGHRGWQSKS